MIELLISKMTTVEKIIKLFKITLELKFIGELSIISIKSSFKADALIRIFISYIFLSIGSIG